MRIEQIELKNCLCFKQLSLQFSPEQNITVILGEQGAGKTALLKQMYHALTWFAGRYKDPRSAGVVMPDADIRIGQRQSKISVSVSVSADIASLPESSNMQSTERQKFSWYLWKTLNSKPINSHAINSNATGLSQVDTAQLELLTLAYQNLCRKDPLSAPPLIAYYPADRFMAELNLLSKNNPAVLQQYAAYDLGSIAYTNFARFFEWFREISDIEHAQQAQFIQGLSPQVFNTPQNISALQLRASTLGHAHLIKNTTKIHNLAEQYFQQVDNPAVSSPEHTAHNIIHSSQQLQMAWYQRVLTARSLLQSRSLNRLNTVLQQVFPEIEALFLQYQPKLELIVRRDGRDYHFQQLPNSLKVGIALVGDVFRRACLLHPHSAYPHLEVEGVLMIDQIDQQLDAAHCGDILVRLEQVFPKLQYVVTGQHRELIEHGEHWQCLQLHQGQLQPLSLLAIRQQWHHVYDTLLREPLPPLVTEADVSTTPDISNIETLWSQIQQLSPEQFTQLKIRFDTDLVAVSTATPAQQFSPP